MTSTSKVIAPELTRRHLCISSYSTPSTSKVIAPELTRDHLLDVLELQHLRREQHSTTREEGGRGDTVGVGGTRDEGERGGDGLDHYY